MIKYFYYILFIFTSCSFFDQFGNDHPVISPSLKNELDTILNDPEFFNAQWGVAIQSFKTGELLYLKNENKNIMPASNMKLFTTGVALVKLSPQFRYCTNLFYHGEISSEGVLSGDIIIKGCGDPSMTARYHDGNRIHVFEMWVDSLSSYGVRVVRGNIIGDDNYFEDEIMGEGWAWDYHSDWYAAQISALSFNDNCMDVIISPGDSVGDFARIQLEPNTDYVEIINHVQTVPGGKQNGISFNRRMGTNCVEISGSIAIHSNTFYNWFSIENPTLFAATIFKQTCEKAGIRIEGSAKDIDDLPGYHYSENMAFRLARYNSPPLTEIVNTINKVSQNLYAELLLRTLGAELKGKGNARNGISVVNEFISTIGINPERFNMVDGSGLSRLNLITPKQIITLLNFMRTHSSNDEFYHSLPVAGVDGSLKNRMTGSIANGRVRAKTGYLGNVVALSGYMDAADDELIFSIISNNYTVPTSMVHALQDRICERIIQHFLNSMRATDVHEISSN